MNDTFIFQTVSNIIIHSVIGNSFSQWPLRVCTRWVPKSQQDYLLGLFLFVTPRCWISFLFIHCNPWVSLLTKKTLVYHILSWVGFFYWSPTSIWCIPLHLVPNMVPSTCLLEPLSPDHAPGSPARTHFLQVHSPPANASSAGTQTAA